MIKDDKKNMLSCDRLPQADHKAFISLGQTNSLNPQTVYNLTYGWREFLRANVNENPAFLRLPNVHDRLTPNAVAIYVAALEQRCNARSIATKLRTLVSFAKLVMPSHDIKFLRVQAQRFESRLKSTKGDEKKDARAFAIAAADLPLQFRARHAALKARGKSGKQYAADLCRHLGAQKEAGVDIDTLQVGDLASEICLVNFEKKLNGKVTPTRITALGAMLKAIQPDIDASAVASRASELRQEVSRNAKSYARKSLPFDQLPAEARARFDFVTTYDGKRSFEFNGEEIFLPKARNLQGRDFSEAMITKMRAALRMHFTLLLAADAALAKVPATWGSDAAMQAYENFYADMAPTTQSSRWEDLIAALRAINGDGKREGFQDERHEIRLLNGVATKQSEPLVVPQLPTRLLRRRACAVAHIALRRWRDLVHSPMPYQDPMRVAGRFRTALIVAIMGEMPARLRTMEMLNIKWIRQVGKIYTFNIPADAMKKRKPYYRELSPGVSRTVAAWLGEVRPFVLRDRPDPGSFFISDEGMTLSRHIFQLSVPAFIETFFEVRVPMHAIRKLHASELVDDPARASRRLQHESGESKKAYQGHAQIRDQSRSSSLYDQSAELFEPS